MQQAHDTFQEVTYHHEPAADTKRIWRTFWILLIITIIELGLGLSIHAFSMGEFLIMLLKGIIVILTIAKAFYIIAVFMHLGDEIRNFVMTIAMPALLFIWFIAAFLWDGNSFKNLRNTHDPYHLEQSKIPVEKKGHAAPEAPAPGSVK